MQDEQNQVEGTEPETEVSPAAQVSGEDGNQPVPSQPGSPEGDTNPETGNEEQQAETSSEDRGESQGENIEAPAEAPLSEAGTEPAADAVPAQNEAEETDATGADEVEGSENVRFDEEGRQIATDEEKAELRSLESKRHNMPVTGDDIARIDYLNTLKHD